MSANDMISNPYWKMNTVMMRAAGIWPSQNKYLKISIRIFILISVHTMMIPQMIRMVKEWGKDSLIVIENITGFVYFQVVITKYITAFTAESKLQYLYEQIMKDWRLFEGKGEQNILRNAGNLGRLLTIGYCGYMYLAGVTFATSPALVPMLLNSLLSPNVSYEKVLCYYGEYFIDQQVYYYQLLFHTFICVMSTISIFTTIDTTYTCCVQHVIGLFNIVDYRLQKAYEVAQNKDKYGRDEADRLIHNYVLSSVEVHKKSIEFFELLQSTYTTCFFLTTGLTLICLSLGTVDVMLNVGNFVNLVRVSFAWVGIILYLFYVSMPSQRLIDASASIFNSVYFCGWYEFPLKTQKLLRFMMMRCTEPCQFTAGPLLVLNLANCGVVLKTSLSYCTFVIALS